MTEEAKPDFNLSAFYQFCDHLRIDSKEFGEILLDAEHRTGTQTYMMEQIADGLNNGVHTFVILKGRQVMCTTMCLALDLYWLFKNKGMSGSICTQDEPTRDMIKDMLTMYTDGLPKEWKQPVKSHNRTYLTLGNRSRFAYQVAGTKKNEERTRSVQGPDLPARDRSRVLG